MNIVFLDRSTFPGDINIHRPSFAHHWQEYAQTEPPDLPDRIQNANVIITNKVVFNRDILTRYARQLDMIAVTATGYDNIDTQTCREHRNLVSNVPSYAAHTVAEHVFMMILTLNRRMLHYRQDIIDGQWQASSKFCLTTHPFSGLRHQTLGIIGAGTIGKTVAAIARSFGMNVLFASAKNHASSSHIEHQQLNQEVQYVSLEQLYMESDVISLHCPLNHDTRNLFTIDTYRKMEKKPIIINTARGGIANEFDTRTALEKNLISAIGFDCLSAEPPTHDNPLLSIAHLPNVIITPHHAWASTSAMQSLWDQVIANVNAFKKGQPQNIVA